MTHNKHYIKKQESWFNSWIAELDSWIGSPPRSNDPQQHLMLNVGRFFLLFYSPYFLFLYLFTVSGKMLTESCLAFLHETNYLQKWRNESKLQMDGLIKTHERVAVTLTELDWSCNETQRQILSETYFLWLNVWAVLEAFLSWILEFPPFVFASLSFLKVFPRIQPSTYSYS